MADETKPSITPMPNGPYVVKNLENFNNVKGTIQAKPVMGLCRCGRSESKPFCDGTHSRVGFSSEKVEGRVEDRRDNYAGKDVTVHDNRGICAHAGYCTDGLPAVFRLREEPFVDPNAAAKDEIVATVTRCPSGALSHSADGTEHRDQDRDVSVFVAPHGPYVVTGGPALEGVERGQGASTEHFTLCRCGGSKNKPFCDGTHWNGFKDDDNA